MLISNRDTTMYDQLKNSIEKANEILINVSFIRDSGIKLLIPYLSEAIQNGKFIKILTSDYMQVTEPNALYRLLEIDKVKIFNNSKNISYHPKTYIFKQNNLVDIYIGSSNISHSALMTGVEWNYHFSGNENDMEIEKILKEFDELYDNNSFEMTLDWLRNYEKNYRKHDYDKIIDFQSNDISNNRVEPIKFQVPALYELSKTREEGYIKAMIVVGTGLGKTYLAAFDSMKFNRILFIAHRDEILRDAKKTFKTVYKDSKSYGYFNGREKSIDRDIIFASISTLSKDEYLTDNYFSKDYFDYIVIDEFHHSIASSYMKVINYFTPKFLLGLTATPDRADNGDIYRLCDYNIAYECDFRVGINSGWLVPFEYYGIYDDTDYTEIPWRSGKYDLKKLENLLIVEKRLELVLKKYLCYRKKYALGFCTSVNHCKVMNSYFNSHKIKSEMIIGSTPFEKRQEIIEKLKNGDLDIIFTVDVFNEGIDIPCVDTILFLRPTQSYTIFIQQLGRGLRTYIGKEKLRVIDFVGNYKGAQLKPYFLMGSIGNRKEISPIDSNFLLPAGCSANFDLQLIEYFENYRNRKDNLKELLKEEFINLKERLNHVPSIIEVYTFSKYPVHTYLQKYSSWYNFLKTIEELSLQEKKFSNRAIEFLLFLEKTPMTKSYKIPLFLSIFKNGLKSYVSLEEIGKFYKNFYQDKLYNKDFNNKKHMDWKKWGIKEYAQLAKENPIKFLTSTDKYIDFFSFKDNKFYLDTDLYKEILLNDELLKNIIDRLEYRNVNYFRRKYMED